MLYFDGLETPNFIALGVKSKMARRLFREKIDKSVRHFFGAQFIGPSEGDQGE